MSAYLKNQSQIIVGMIGLASSENTRLLGGRGHALPEEV